VQPQVWIRVFKLCVLTGAENKLLVGYWILNLCILALYSWLYYQVSIGSGNFLSLVVEYASGNGTYYTLDQFRYDFYTTLWQVGLETFSLSVSYAFLLMISHRIGLVMRRHITDKALSLYFTNNVYYEINNFELDLDNVDQRLATDVRLFCYHFADFTWGTLYYNGVLPAVSLSVAFTILLYQNGAGMGLAIAYLSFIAFSFINAVVGSYVATAGYRANTEYGYYQYAHTHLRNHAEHVAFYKGGPEEHSTLQRIYFRTHVAASSFIKRMFFLNFTTTLYTWLSTSFSYALPGIIFLQFWADKSASSAAVLVALTAYNYYLQNTFYYTLLLSEVNSLVMNHSTRITEVLNRLKVRAQTSQESRKADRYHFGNCIILKNMRCVTPDGKILFNDLNLQTEPGQNLLISGPSGTGKSSILRTICGLWPAQQGDITLPVKPNGGLFFLPQKPYLTLGTLREQFTYPKSFGGQQSSVPLKQTIRELLDMVDLAYILERFGVDTINDWAVILSVGEQQRIGMARLLFHRPQFAILDECSSAVDTALEKKFFRQCIALGINFISVAHRESCHKYHDVHMRLEFSGTYTVSKIEVKKKTKKEN